MMIADRKNTRGRIEIIASILFHCKEGIKKTHIMCKANVGYEQLCYYLPNLIDTKLVTQDIEDGSVIYRTTDTGREFLKFYCGMMKLIKQENKNLWESAIFVKNCPFDEFPTSKLNKQVISILEETEI